MAKKFRFKSSKPREKIKVFRCVDEFELLKGATGAHIEIFSNSEILIEGCRGVYEYTDNYLKLKLSKGYLEICGNNFDIKTYENDVLTVKCIISRIEFCV